MRDLSLRSGSGPLSRFAAGFAAELVATGYGCKGRATQMRLLADADGWLAREGLDARALGSTDQLERFLRARRRAGRSSLVTRRAFVFRSPLLDYLRRQGVVVHQHSSLSEVDVLLEEYRGYLLGERGLVAGTVDGYLRVARRFFSGRDVRSVTLDLVGLTAGGVIEFVLSECQARRGEVACIVAGLRSLLRFLHVRGLISAPLAEVVPRVAGWHLVGLPRPLEPAQVAALLAAPDRLSPVGSRNYAMVLMLARMGLRRCEVAALTLDDIDWVAGEIAVTGKGGRLERLPLPDDVGQALAEYLQEGRPASAQGRQVFMRVMPPHTALTPHGVTEVVIVEGKRAGLGYVTAQRLRHTAARELLRAGAPLEEIGQLLRHRSRLTTTIYAKVDRERLGELARPWPMGGTA
jgi:integrase/recombinase XerD